MMSLLCCYSNTDVNQIHFLDNLFNLLACDSVKQLSCPTDLLGWCAYQQSRRVTLRRIKSIINFTRGTHNSVTAKLYCKTFMDS